MIPKLLSRWQVNTIKQYKILQLRHTLYSAKYNDDFNYNACFCVISILYCTCIYLLEQSNPSPSYPIAHLQAKLPGVFVQLALWWQGKLRHSSISRIKKNVFVSKYLQFYWYKMFLSNAIVNNKIVATKFPVANITTMVWNSL